MTEVLCSPKIKPEHLARRAIVYLRQSSDKQVRQNLESQRLQYEVAERIRGLGWRDVEIIDSALGSSAGMASARREGFERVLSSVALGEVGIVGSRDASRLSRTDKDWCRLLEVCQIFGTLIADEQQIYDLNYLDDQLVLGIKGTLSVVELKVLRQRMHAGQESKARRGEMYKRLPVGYALDPMGKVVLHPDQRVCEAIRLVFLKFRERWSIRQAFLWFRDHDIELPANAIRGTGLVWKVPTQSLVRDILVNPFYAGAYVWGRRPMETILVDVQLKKRQTAYRRAEDCRVFIADHHEGYIDWGTYEENQRTTRRNSVNWQGDVEIPGSGLQVHMTEQDLNRAQVCSCLEQVGRPTVAQGVRRYMLLDTRIAGGFFTGVPDGLIRDRSFRAALMRAAGKKIGARLLPAPILAQRLQQSRAEWEIATGATLTAFHADHHAPAVDVAHLEQRYF